MKVLKFGGTSVGNPERIEAVIKIVADSIHHDGPVVVVASAMAGVTNQLIALSQQAVQRQMAYRDELQQLRQRHLVAAEHLLPKSHQAPTISFVHTSFNELEDILHGVEILRELTPRTLDLVMSFGERLSCALLAEAMKHRNIPAEYLDARTVIKTDLNYGAARVNFDITNWNLINHFRNRTATQVVTGFIASGKENETTTLGRGGSDYTASIIGAALDAEEIQIWTDVDGVMTADPRKVRDAFPLEAITYEEAMELSHFGAKVIHPPTMVPALNRGINIRILNTFKPEARGTLITAKKVLSDRSVKGIASLDAVSLLNVRGIGLMRTVGIASRIFSALARRGIDVILVTQSSSEQRVCLAVSPQHRLAAREALQLEFRLEIHSGDITDITIEDDFSLIAVVGEEARTVPGVTGKVFQALGRNGINVRAIAQGSSELNTTIVVKRSDELKALNALHDNLFLSKLKTLNLFLVGPGLVGGALLDLLRDQSAYLEKSLHTRIRLVGLANRKKMVFNADGISLSRWRETLTATEQNSDLSQFVEKVKSFNLANSVFVDTTGTEDAVRQYLPLLESSVSVVTSSKISNTLSQDFYGQLRATVDRYNARFRYSTSVGAALPVIESLKALIDNGEKIERIEGVLSGTISHIFNTLRKGTKFSDAVREAQKLGYTEPDPLVDLRGLDVARKLLILMREAGIKAELSDIHVDQIVPEPLQQQASRNGLESIFGSLDENIEKRVAAARGKGAVLMYIATFDGGKACVAIEEVLPTHPFYNLTGNDNIVSITTSSLYRQPFVVRGAGAGARQTAAGLLTDLLNVSRSLS